MVCLLKKTCLRTQQYLRYNPEQQIIRNIHLLWMTEVSGVCCYPFPGLPIFSNFSTVNIYYLVLYENLRGKNNPSAIFRSPLD